MMKPCSASGAFVRHLFFYWNALYLGVAWFVYDFRFLFRLLGGWPGAPLIVDSSLWLLSNFETRRGPDAPTNFPRCGHAAAAADADAEGDLAANPAVTDGSAPLPGASNFKGVSWCPRHGRWLAEIWDGARFILLGAFAAELDAARAYDAACLERHGFAALTNLPFACYEGELAAVMLMELSQATSGWEPPAGLKELMDRVLEVTPTVQPTIEAAASGAATPVASAGGAVVVGTSRAQSGPEGAADTAKMARGQLLAEVLGEGYAPQLVMSPTAEKRLLADGTFEWVSTRTLPRPANDEIAWWKEISIAN
jgi:hypothetical protein